jgi:galactose mutarotase-like enzyme
MEGRRMTIVQRGNHGGLETFVLGSTQATITVVPERGGKIVSIVSNVSGREWLWRDPHRLG